jgi:sulfite exporter TauE/SafE
VIALAGSVLLASLIGSPHCAGMCGGFVCFYAGAGDARRWLAHAAYNAGRLVSYAALGAIAGASGAGVDRMGAAAGVSRAAAILAGALMVAWGVAAALEALGLRVRGVGEGALARGGFGAVLRAVRAQPAPLRALVVGLLTTLLPCGFLYVFVATAAATGGAASGALVMAAFWIGTVPVMAGLGVLAQRALGPLRRRLPLVTATALIVVGLLTLTGRFQAAPVAGKTCPLHRPAHGGH